MYTQNIGGIYIGRLGIEKIILLVDSNSAVWYRITVMCDVRMYLRTYASSTVSLHCDAETKTNKQTNIQLHVSSARAVISFRWKQ